MIEQLGAVAACCNRLAARANDLRAVPGLADDLHSIGEALAQLELVARVLARVYLAQRFGYSLTAREYRYVAELAGEVDPLYLVRCG